MSDGLGAIRDVRLEQAARSDWSQVAAGAWLEASALWRHLREDTNLPAATERFDWGRVLPGEATVLELGCGSGWLAGLLSRRDDVARVIAWDASERLLSEVVPAMVQLVEGDPAKIDRVCGRFAPLVLDDASVDAVVMSSAFHHADDADALLAEISRVLRPGGCLVLLNETPLHLLAVVSLATRLLAGMARILVRARGRPFAGALAGDHVLYDPSLGDRGWTMNGWRALAARAGCELEVVATGLHSYPERQRPPQRLEPQLTHFILRPR
jgi:SAM-dependent methyltransferase